MSKTLLSLDNGGHAFIEGVACFPYIAGETDQEWHDNLAELRRQWPALKNMPLGKCSRSIELVQVSEGRVLWRAAFILELENAHVFMGVSAPISLEDVRRNHGLIWLASPGHTPDFAEGVEAVWRRDTRRIFERTSSGMVPDSLMDAPAPERR